MPIRTSGDLASNGGEFSDGMNGIDLLLELSIETAQRRALSPPISTSTQFWLVSAEGSFFDSNKIGGLAAD